MTRTVRNKLPDLTWAFLCTLFVSTAAHAQQARIVSAQFVEQSVPAQMNVGVSYPVEIKIKNVGTTGWSDQRNFAVVIQSPGGNLSWGVTRVGLGSDVVSTGEVKTFRFNVTAPSKPDSYQFSWNFLLDGLPVPGLQALATTVVVSDPFANGEFISQMLPQRLDVGQPFKVIVQYRNTGQASWSKQHGYRLLAITPDAKRIWGVTQVEFDSDQHILPGTAATFTIQGRAPIKPGEYDFQWQMYQDDREWFGDPTPKVTVAVADPSAQVDVALDLKSEFVSQSVSTSMKAGESYRVSIAMKNTGASKWRYPQVTLISQNPEDNLTWLVNRVDMVEGETVASGEVKLFAFDVIAPNESGVYPFQWRLIHETMGVFGAKTDGIMISVQ